MFLDQYRIPPGYDVDGQLRGNELKIGVQAVGDALLLNRPEVMRQGYFVHKIMKSMSLCELLMQFTHSAAWEDFCKADANAELILAQVVHTFEERKPLPEVDMKVDSEDGDNPDSEEWRQIQERGINLYCECELEYDGTKEFEKHIHQEACELKCYCDVRFEDLKQFNSHLIACNSRVKRACKAVRTSQQ